MVYNFWVWFFKLSKNTWRFVCVINGSFCLLVYLIGVYSFIISIYYCLFTVHSLNSFQFGAVTSKDAMNICVQGSYK